MGTEATGEKVQMEDRELVVALVEALKECQKAKSNGNGNGNGRHYLLRWAVERLGVPAAFICFMCAVMWFGGAAVWSKASIWFDDYIAAQKVERESINRFLNTQIESTKALEGTTKTLADEWVLQRDYRREASEAHAIQIATLQSMISKMDAAAELMHDVPAQRAREIELLGEIRDGIKNAQNN